MDKANKVTFEQEAKIYEEKARAEIIKMSGDGSEDPSEIACILQMGRRVIYGAMQALANRDEVVMNKPYVYYKEQCKYCLRKGKCDYKKATQTFVDTISGVEKLAKGVYGSLSFKCDYFALDQLAYNRANPPESNG